MAGSKEPLGEKTKDKSELYKCVEELPDDRKKKYSSLLEDFERQASMFLNEVLAESSSQEEKIRSKYKVLSFQLPKNVRKSNFEDFMSKSTARSNSDENPTATRISSELAHLSEKVEGSISDKVKHATAVVAAKSKVKKSRKVGRPATVSAKKLPSAQTPSVESRRCTRSRADKQFSISETPMMPPGYPLTSTANHSRMMSRQAQTPFQTLPNNISLALPVITPKFNVGAPLLRTVMRTAKPNETLVSLGGSPVYVNGRTRGARQKKSDGHIPVPLGDGKTLMVPTNVQDDCQDAPHVELDEAARKKLIALRNQLNSMLKNDTS